ncbi:MAG: hypothetical protein ACKOBW_16345 [Planctomycetota bacterium]
MGTYYAIGIVRKFTAKAKRAIVATALEAAVRERLDLRMFELNYAADGACQGTLKPGLFAQHIEGFVNKLAEIDRDCAAVIRYYFENYGTDIDQYESHACRMRIPHSEGLSVDVLAEMVPVFVEGKVRAECFSVEPVLINWLFRQCDFGNPLAGIVVSGIIG